jgi:hypothetical protein
MEWHRSRNMGTCTPGKLQRILASGSFSQHAKLNMAGFVLYLPVRFGLRYRMVELPPKNKKLSSPFTAKDAEGAKEEKGLPRMGPDWRNEQRRGRRYHTSIPKPTPFWDDLGPSTRKARVDGARLGCGGIPR